MPASERIVWGPSRRVQYFGPALVTDCTTTCERSTGLRAAGGDLVLAVTAGKLDQVLVELEPCAVIAVDPG